MALGIAIMLLTPCVSAVLAFVLSGKLADAETGTQHSNRGIFPARRSLRRLCPLDAPLLPGGHPVPAASYLLNKAVPCPQAGDIPLQNNTDQSAATLVDNTF